MLDGRSRATSTSGDCDARRGARRRASSTEVNELPDDVDPEVAERADARRPSNLDELAHRPRPVPEPAPPATTASSRPRRRPTRGRRRPSPTDDDHRGRRRPRRTTSRGRPPERRRRRSPPATGAAARAAASRPAGRRGGGDRAAERRRRAPGATAMNTTISDRYELGDRLGSGGMSTVYRATDRVLERTVAVKILAEHLSDDEQVRRPLPPRGARGREADPPEHRPGLRHRRRRRPPLHRHGVRRGQVGRPAAADARARSAPTSRSRSASRPAPGSSTPTARGSSTATSSPGT